MLVSGVLLGAAVGTASAATVTPGYYAASPSTILLAKNGADDAVPGCDDHGTDLCLGTVEQVAKNGADDAVPGCDDNGTDVCLGTVEQVAKNGADDAVPGCDDHGTDLCVRQS